MILSSTDKTLAQTVAAFYPRCVSNCVQWKSSDACRKRYLFVSRTVCIACRTCKLMLSKPSDYCHLSPFHLICGAFYRHNTRQFVYFEQQCVTTMLICMGMPTKLQISQCENYSVWTRLHAYCYYNYYTLCYYIANTN